MSDLPATIRAFVAVRIPDDILAQLAAFQKQLKADFRSVSWTRPEAMHLTLQFLGNIQASHLPALSGGLKAATRAHPPFALQLAGAGVFGNRVLWVGVGAGAAPLKQLANAVRLAAKDFAAHEETRDFNAHVTLGRQREPERGAAAILRKAPAPDLRPWQVEDVELIRSELSPKGSRYTTLETFPLPLAH
jgi:2'-5' RNA ligase